MLKDGVDRLVAERYSFDQRKGYLADAQGWSRALWKQYAEMGLLSLPFEEKYGGFGGGPVETMLVMEAFGRGLILEPYFATVVLAGGAIRMGGSEAQKAALLPKIADGSLIMAFAQAEAQSRYNLADVRATAKKDGAGWVIDGEKTLVLHGDSADKLVVVARVSGAQRERDGLGLFVVDASAPGVTRRPFIGHDDRRGADIVLAGVKVGVADVIGEPGKAYAVIERVIQGGIAALAAEGVGAMSAMLDITVEYLKTREQFGVPIGSFQVLQHRAVDMLTALEQGRSMALYGTIMAEDPDPVERAKAMAAVKVQLGKSTRYVGQQGTQLHGGIGMTMESRIGRYFMRTTVMELQFGDTEHHLAALAEAGGLD